MILDRIKKLEAARAAQANAGIGAMTEAEIDAELAAAFGARVAVFFDAVQRGDLLAGRALEAHRQALTTTDIRKLSVADVDAELALFVALINTRLTADDLSTFA